MTEKEKRALLNILFYIFGCMIYLAGAKIPDNIVKDLKTLGYKENK
ncbi:MAG: hypothetical protein IJ545_04865 [Alphaproteobacteria bacterium]|nr:hypothetical protein [Alphaproteobacteria bacterium]